MMNNSGIDPQMARQAADTRDMVRFKQEMDGLKQRLGAKGEDREKQLRKVCKDFEAIFISKLWKGMKNTVPKEGYLHSKQEEQYLSMFDREFAQNMAKAGGIGLADMIYEQMSEKLKNTSRTTLGGGVDIKPLAEQPIELDKKSPIDLSGKESAMTLEDWGGETVSEKFPMQEQASASVVSGGSDVGTGGAPLNDIEVKARIESLARRLEAERIKADLLGQSSVDEEA